MADQILPKGIRFFNKKASQPDFVIGALVITFNELVNFGKENPELLSEYNGEKQLRLQVLKSKEGNLYASVDTFKPTTGAIPATPSAPPYVAPVLPTTGSSDGDLPF
jgi:hypothetical protein